jgi:succinyl-diaminopimelate desuccinylase
MQMSIRDQLVRLTHDLVSIPSVSDDPVAREAVIDFVAGFCASLPGVQTFRFEADGKPALVAAFDDRRHKGLVLNAHVDVVPGRDEQFRPFERDGRIYGRGTQDMKGATAAMLLVLKDLAERGVRPGVAWQFVTDEEIGGEGTRNLLASGYTCDFFLAGEPTDLEIVNRAKGMLWLRVRQTGNPAHGSRPWDGLNPIMPLARGVLRLLDQYPVPERPVWKTTATPSAIHGGDAHNRVPADCLLQLDVRRVPDEDEETILSFIESCFEGGQLDVLHSGGALQTAENDPHVQRLRMIAGRHGASGAFRDEHFGSDARFYSEAGLPAVCFGPLGAGLHSHDEWVDIASLEMYYAIIRELAESY